jgi:hypothetical protein
MPTNNEVLDIIEDWSGQRPLKMSQSLEEWWNETAPDSSHSGLVFDPDGITDLVNRLQEAFPDPPHVESADFRATGSVKSVQDLVDVLQPVISNASTAALISKPRVARSKKPRVVSRKTGKKKSGKKKKKGARQPVKKRRGR